MEQGYVLPGMFPDFNWQILIIVSIALISLVVTLMVCSWSYLEQDVIKEHNLDNYAVCLRLGGHDDYLCDLPNMCSTCKPIRSYLQQDSGLKFSELLWTKKNLIFA